MSGLLDISATSFLPNRLHRCPWRTVSPDLARGLIAITTVEPEKKEEFAAEIKAQMNKSAIHDAWEGMYRSDLNEQVYQYLYDKFLSAVGHKEGAKALDIGSGIGANSVRLARHGYHVVAADYSEAILPRTRENVARHGLSDRVDVQREDITKMSFADGSFDLTLCWGVLMHVPEIEPSLDELVRVTAPDGYLVISEINPQSIEAVALRSYWRLLKRSKISITPVAEGYEHRTNFAGKSLFWRHLNPDWLARSVEKRGCNIELTMPGHLFEAVHYIKPKFVENMLHRLNRAHARGMALEGIASTRIYIIRKGGGPR